MKRFSLSILLAAFCLSQVHAQQNAPPGPSPSPTASSSPRFGLPAPPGAPAQPSAPVQAVVPVPVGGTRSNGKVQKSLVRITVTAQEPDYRAPWNAGAIGRGVGAGFVIDGNRIMTNAHVVSNARYLTVERDGDPNKYPAKVLFVAHDCDLALITVSAPNFFKNMVPLQLGGIPELESVVSAYGYPIGGERMSVTTGIVSRIDFQLYTHSSIDQHLAIQISAQINPGNSGGPVMQNAKVVGVAFQGYSGDIAQGVAYMIPTPVIRRFLKDIEDGHYDRYVDLGLGVIWQHVHYIVGLNRLGHDVYYVEDSARLPYNPQTFEVNNDYDYAGKVLGRLAREFGFQRRWGFCARYLPTNPTVGLSLKTIQQLYREADAIFNVCGAQELNGDLRKSDRLIYIESDPGVEQIRVDQKNKSTIEYLGQHRALFTFGENIGTKKFPVPLRGMKWLPTRQPIVTDLWKTNRRPAGSAVFTTIANWSTSGLKDITWRGNKYLWSKSREFLRFVNAPRKAGEPLEMATDIKEKKIRQKFQRYGWRLRSPHDLSIDYWLYRDYIRRSKGEFTVAKDQYVRLCSGWFSDRSACYLAAGRPVITQQTGFTEHYGNEGGLFAYNSLGEIVEAVKVINSSYALHSRAARAIAHEVFEAEKVLASLLDRAGV